MNIQTLTHAIPAQPPALKGFLQMLLLALAVRRERRNLQDLPKERLMDLGLTPTSARTEACRGFWDIPTRNRH